MASKKIVNSVWGHQRKDLEGEPSTCDFLLVIMRLTGVCG